MPFIDLNNYEEIITKNYDFTIIGAGAAGITLAMKLSLKGFKVNIIESGNFKENLEGQKLNEVNHSGKYLNSATIGRRRAVGGTTTIWGGQSLPFEKLDFEKRDWIKNSGWPISYKEVAKYYDDANKFMNVDTLGYDDEILKLLKLNNVDLTNDKLKYHVSKWANEPNFAKLHYKYIEEKIDLYYNANLNALNYHEQEKKITNINIFNFNKQKFIFNVNKLIICAGGIESIRILLLSKIPHSNWLGKGFMEHPSIECGTISPNNNYLFQKIFSTQVYKQRKYSIRLSLSETEQKCKKLLNSSATILFVNKSLGNEDLIDPYKELKMFFKDYKPKRLKIILKAIPIFYKSLKSILFDGFIFKANTVAKLTLMVEQSPKIESYIELCEDLDMFSQNKAAVNWGIDPLVWETVVSTCNHVKNLIEGKNLGIVNLYPHINYQLSNFENYLSAVNHHMGGTKMGNSIKDSVVDENLKVWECENLFVCSSSIFPTGSHSNPTLTLMALTCRLADHLESINNS